MDPITIGSAVAGVVKLTIQIAKVVSDWNDAPTDTKAFVEELGMLKMVLQETTTNILWNPEFAAAFQERRSLLLAHLDTPLLPTASSTVDTLDMLQTCEKELGDMLIGLKKRAEGHRLGLKRLKGAFLAQSTRDAVVALSRRCQTLNQMISIDSIVLQARTYNNVTAARKEQEERHQEQMEVTSAIKDAVDREDHRAVLDWLTQVDYTRQQADFINRRQAGTGQWLLNSTKYQGWLKSHKQTLFCPGIPGAGKTILTSIVVEDLCHRFQNDATVGIAYLYCNFQRQYEQTSEHLLRSLLKQLVQKQSPVPISVEDLRNRHKDKGSPPEHEEISKVIQSVASAYSRIFIIIDALDECQQHDGCREHDECLQQDGCRARFLSEMFNLQANTKANIFATSRPIREVERKFKRYTILKISANDEDLRKYLDCRVSQLQAFVGRSPEAQEKLKTEIKAVIVKAVDGMYVFTHFGRKTFLLTSLLRFLLTQLYLTLLDDKPTPKAVRNALKRFQKQAEESDDDKELGILTQAYQQTMERVTGQKKGFRLLAEKVLSWITCAKRPLTTSELQHALAVEAGESELDEDNLPYIDNMIAVCYGLVTVEEETNIIRLVHNTTQEYFKKTRKDWFPDAEEDIARTCVTYLSFSKFESGFCRTDEEFNGRLQLNPLYNYAARNWGHHSREASVGIEQLVVGFLESEAKVSGCSQAMMSSSGSSGYSQRAARQMRGVHLAAYFGLRDTITTLLKNGHDVDPKDGFGRTPLSYAAEHGQEAMAKQLLARSDVDVNSKSEYGWTPLFFAVLGGHKAVVRQLLARNDVDIIPNVKGWDHRLQNFLQLWEKRQTLRESKGLLHPVKVAVIDTGVVVISNTDSDFSGNIHSGISFVRDGYREQPWWLASDAHGTQISRLIRVVNPFCKLYIAKVGDREADVTISQLAKVRGASGSNSFSTE
jgi:hypothetical protein